MSNEPIQEQAPIQDDSKMDSKVETPAPDATPEAPEGPAEVAHGMQHWLVAGTVLCCFVGQIFIWIKEMAIKPELNTVGNLNSVMRDPMQLGAFSFMMFLTALVNYMSLRTAQPWLYVASVAVALSMVLDVNICVTDWLTDRGTEERGDNKAWNWELRTGYYLSLIGFVGSFLAMPVDFANIKLDVTAIVGMFIGAWLIFANVAIWSNEGGLKDGSFVCPYASGYKSGSAIVDNLVAVGAGQGAVAAGQIPVPAGSTRDAPIDTGLPIHVSRAFTTGLLHLAASLFQWEGGQWMTFIIACISVADYQPAGSGPGRCNFGNNIYNTSDKGCEAGVWLSFIGMWGIIIATIVLKRGAKMPDFAKANPMNGARSLFGLVGPLMCIVGMIIVANEHHSKNGPQSNKIGNINVGTYRDKEAQETYDVFQTAVGALFIFWGYLASNNRIGVAGLSLHFGVMNRLLGAGGPGLRVDFIGACPWKYASHPEGIHKLITDDIGVATARTGYILLLAGALLTVVALCDLDSKRSEVHKNVQIVTIMVIACVTWLWTAEKWYGQMGYTAFLAALFHTFQYKQGLDAVFFWACSQLASQTPFTSCETKGEFPTFVVTIATLGLFYVAYNHLEVRGDAKGEPEEDEPAEEVPVDGDVADPEAQ